ncbi:MAG: LytTR family transcriptional regulator [Clostridia bacterium]|nr:LytTR family transcriptional regulator [Clostridia bacterium]
MKCTIVIDKDRDEEVIIYLKKPNEISGKIQNLVGKAIPTLVGYSNENIVNVDVDDVFCFSVQEGRVYAFTQNEQLLVKERLYMLEQQFGDRFVKINQSCLVSPDKIARFDTSVGASLRVTLKNGYFDYVSRRQMKVVKKRMGL